MDSSSVYWTGADDLVNGTVMNGTVMNGTVMKVPLAGGTPTTLASGQNGPRNIAVDASSVYWINCGPTPVGPSTSSVMKVPLAGGMPTTLASGSLYSDRIVVDATSVYWVDLGFEAFGGVEERETKSIMQVPISGGTPVALASSTDIPVDIAVDAAHVYWTTEQLTSPPTGAVLKAPLAGGAPTTLVSGYGSGAIAVDATSVYWIDPSAPSVMQVALAGGTPTTLASDQGDPSDMAVDASNIYWIDAGTYNGDHYVDGTVMKLPLAGGVPTALISGLSYADGSKLALDASSVYWTVRVDSQYAVMKLTPK